MQTRNSLVSWLYLAFLAVFAMAVPAHAVTTYDFTVMSTETAILVAAGIAAIVALVPIMFGWFGLKAGILALVGFIKKMWAR